MSGRDRPGALALVLHSHMPYVEGFGTWPFGEEWLWEAVACVYLPLLELLDGAPVTVGLTPVLCDQLDSMRGDAGERYVRFLREVRAPIHEAHPAIAAEVVHAVRRELARRIDDVLSRRLHLTTETADLGASAIQPVSEIMARELGWTAENTAREIELARAALLAGSRWRGLSWGDGALSGSERI